MPGLDSYRARQRGSSRLPALLSLVVLFGGGVLAYRHFFNRPGESAIQLLPADALMVATLDTSPSPQQIAAFKRIGDGLKRENLDTSFDNALKDIASNGKAANGNSVVAQVRPFWRNSFAFAMLKKPGDKTMSNPDAVMLAAVSDTGQVRDILAKNGQKQTQDGMEYYSIPTEKMCATLISGNMVVSDKPGPLARIQAVYKGEAASIATLEEYKQARAALPADANMMLFMSPRAWAQAMNDGTANKSLTSATSSALQNARWVAMGLTVRDGGIEIVTQTPVTAPNNAPMPAAPAPLRPDLAKHLPSGAYGLMTYAQPARYWDWLQLAANQNNSFKKSMDEGIASFENQTGLSVPQDVLPGLQGDLTLAVYPDAEKAGTTGADGLIVIDDANGANPANLTDKIRAIVERESVKNGKSGVHFVSTQRNGATIWTLDESSRTQLQHSIAGGPDTSPIPPSASPNPPAISSSPSATGEASGMGDVTVQTNGNDFHMHSNGASVDADKNGLSLRGNDGSSMNADSNGFSVHSSNGANVEVDNNGVRVAPDSNSSGKAEDGYVERHEADTVREVGQTTEQTEVVGANGHVLASADTTAPASQAAEALKNKTIAYAQIGNTILMSSSPALLDRAIDTYQSGNESLADDPHYGQMFRSVPTGSQTALLVSIPRIMEAFRPMIVKGLQGDRSGLTPEDFTEICGGASAGIVGTGRYDGKSATATFFLPLDFDKAIHVIGVLKKQNGL